MVTMSSNPTDESLLIGKLVSRAAELYESYGACGNRCNHPSGSCSDEDAVWGSSYSCLACSNEVHFPESNGNTSHREKYDCEKFVCYYTCRYSWKYCSEIMYALETVDLKEYNRFNILSLGCGPAPDLMAFEQINREYRKPIFYRGYDINPYWRALHGEIKRYCSQHHMEARFRTEDVFDALETRKVGKRQYNVVVMQYLFSSFADLDRSQLVNRLCDLFISKVVPMKKAGEPFLILINDIDHHTRATDHFDIPVKKLKDNGYHITYAKRHFEPRSWDFGDGSVQYGDCRNKFVIPKDIGDKFHRAIVCRSAQLVLEVR